MTGSDPAAGAPVPLRGAVAPPPDVAVVVATPGAVRVLTLRSSADTYFLCRCWPSAWFWFWVWLRAHPCYLKEGKISSRRGN